jgi:hypothetical protein
MTSDAEVTVELYFYSPYTPSLCDFTDWMVWGLNSVVGTRFSALTHAAPGVKWPGQGPHGWFPFELWDPR